MLFVAALAVSAGFAQDGVPNAAPSAAPTSASEPKPQAVSSDTYIIGESDLLSITVWHEPDLTRMVPVRTDGKITLPLIGDLEAAGQTAEQLRVAITTKLKRVMEDPNVTVIVQEPRSQYFTVVGKVAKPGSFPLAQQLTVLDGLAMSGGLKDFAKATKIYVVRTHRDGKTERLAFNYKKAIDGDLQQNFALEARDMIIVP